jgi:photosystem I subunit 11
MASQLKSSLASSLGRRLVIPRGISGAPFRVSPNKRSFTVKAVQADKVRKKYSFLLPAFSC